MSDLCHAWPGRDVSLQPMSSGSLLVKAGVLGQRGGGEEGLRNDSPHPAVPSSCHPEHLLSFNKSSLFFRTFLINIFMRIPQLKTLKTTDLDKPFHFPGKENEALTLVQGHTATQW